MNNTPLDMFSGFAESENRHKVLCEEIAKHDHAYYNDDEPLISDGEYDALRAELLEIEKQYPE